MVVLGFPALRLVHAISKIKTKTLRKNVEKSESEINLKYLFWMSVKPIATFLVNAKRESMLPKDQLDKLIGKFFVPTSYR